MLRRGAIFVAFSTVAVTTGFIVDKAVNDELYDYVPNLMRKRISDEENSRRPKVVILGSGWAAMAMVRKLHADKYNVVIISPRNYFLFTPMLAGSTVGTVEHRSIIEPVRNILERSDAKQAVYIQAECVKVNPTTNTIHCVEPSNSEGFDVTYDHLVVAVGCQPATFGIKGVQENAFFMKEISDSQKIRDKLQDVFETASIPGKSDEEKERLLHVCVVGAGPSGVELCGEVEDFIAQDMSKKFPTLVKHSKITLIEALPNILSMFDKKLVEFAESKLIGGGVNVRTSTMVTSVDEKKINLKSGESIPYGTLVWVAGITSRPVTRQIIESLGTEHQKNRNGLIVDKHMLVNGTSNIWAIGDCAISGNPPTAQVAAQEGIYVARLFNSLYETFDKREEGELKEAIAKHENFSYRHFGNFAYIGGNRAIGQIPSSASSNGDVQIKGEGAFYLWRSVYLSKLLSPRNRILVSSDWVKAKTFGRDISRA